MTVIPAGVERCSKHGVVLCAICEWQKPLLWIMLKRGHESFRLTPAEAPCWKGECIISFRWFHVVIGWEKQTPAASGSDGDAK